GGRLVRRPRRWLPSTLTLGVLGAALALGAALLAAPGPAAAQARPADPLAVAMAGLAAVNAGDVAALPALTTDSPSLQEPPGPGGSGLRIEGQQAVLGFWRQGATAGLQARPVGTARVAGATVTWTLRFTDQGRRAQGEAGQVTVEVTVAGGRIAALAARDVS